jgi:deazaflavin-dependent oxidoreductase (nitroreductase family)
MIDEWLGSDMAAHATAFDARGASRGCCRAFLDTDDAMTDVQRPSALVGWLNRLWGVLNRLGIGLDYSYELEVPGRRSGVPRRTPVNLMPYAGHRYLVAPRGRTEWVRNAEAHGSVLLRRGSKRLRIRLEPVPPDEAPLILKTYLQTYRSQVQQFFSVPPDANIEEFARIAANHPVFKAVEIAT